MKHNTLLATPGSPGNHSLTVMIHTTTGKTVMKFHCNEDFTIKISADDTKDQEVLNQALELECVQGIVYYIGKDK